ncbi:MAG: hypothetical protein QJR02_11410 [Sinobacteraceae bacterium]|nr:hypothetical protein [Nevskiaceae bacterium]
MNQREKPPGIEKQNTRRRLFGVALLAVLLGIAGIVAFLGLGIVGILLLALLAGVFSTTLAFNSLIDGLSSIGYMLFVSAGPLLVGFWISTYLKIPQPTFIGLLAGICFLWHVVSRDNMVVAPTLSPISNLEPSDQVAHATIPDSQIDEIRKATSPIEIAVRTSRIVEALLAEHFGASGKGLHEKIDSAALRLSPDAMRQLRYVATIRNRLVHEANFNLDEHQVEAWRVQCLRAIQMFSSQTS